MARPDLDSRRELKRPDGAPGGDDGVGSNSPVPGGNRGPVRARQGGPEHISVVLQRALAEARKANGQ